ncbi:hypothetical protein Tco_0609053 [Tanacetum coccineum]
MALDTNCTQKEAAGTDGQTLEQTKLSQVAHKAIKAIRKYHRAINESRAQKRKVPWSNERLLENKELNAIIGVWFTLWRD